MIRRALRSAWRVYTLFYLLLFATSFVAQWRHESEHRDIGIYYRAATQAVDPGMYEPLPPPGPITTPFIPLYPPPLFAAMSTAAALPFVWFARVWRIVLAASFWAFAAACGRIGTGRYALWPTLTVAMLVGLTPAFIVPWNMSNVDILVWALVALGLAHAGTARGVMLGLSTVIKVMPVWSLLFALRERNVWKGVAWAVGGSIAMMIVTLGPAGMWSESWTWLTRIAPVIAAGERWTESTTFVGSPYPRWMTPDNLSPASAIAPHLGSFADAWMLLTGVGIPIAVGILLRRRSVTFQVAGVLAATILAGPILRINYLPLLLPSVLVWWRGRVQVAVVPAAIEPRDCPDSGLTPA